MNKNKLIKTFYILLITTLLSSSLNADDFFGMALSVKGEAYLVRGIIEFEMKVEDKVRYGDEIETGEDGFIQLSFKSSFLVIGPNSIITISKDEDGEIEVIQMELEKGDLRSRILKLADSERYEVVTDKGVVKVTGTDFVTSFNEDSESMSVAVLKGSVDVVPSESEENGTREGVFSIGLMQSGGMGGTTPERVSTLSSERAKSIKVKLPLPGEAGGKKNTASSSDDFSLDITKKGEGQSEGSEVQETSNSVEPVTSETETPVVVETEIETEVNTPVVSNETDVANTVTNDTETAQSVTNDTPVVSNETDVENTTPSNTPISAPVETVPPVVANTPELPPLDTPQFSEPSANDLPYLPSDLPPTLIREIAPSPIITENDPVGTPDNPVDQPVLITKDPVVEDNPVIEELDIDSDILLSEIPSSIVNSSNSDPFATQDIAEIAAETVINNEISSQIRLGTPGLGRPSSAN